VYGRSRHGTGLATQAPARYVGLAPRRSGDYAGVGFIWSRPSAVMEPVAHHNEYGLEAMYQLQLTPFTSLQTDVQFLWNPAGNPAAERNIVFQLQLNLTW
jgi:carbohydrate-selective porin OprB